MEEKMNEDLATPKRLYRSRTDRIVGGVAAGLAQYFDVDPTLLRLAFVILAFAGFGVLGYLILWLVVPVRPEGEPEPAISGTLDTGRGRRAAAYVLIALGTLLLAANLGWLDAYWARLIWPLVLVAVGLALLTARGRGLSAPRP
jgi:phage shock protein PspC (stress-responsive transcriptional regulator)